MGPLISVIVPVYNAEQYLDECVQSIVNQTYSNLEIILVDDGSPDRCPDLCDKWARCDDRIKVIHKHNGGASSARNAALDIAAGEYIGFVDSDDYIDRTMYEELFNLIQSGMSNASCCVIHRFNSNSNCVKANNFAECIEYNAIDAVNAMFINKTDTSVCNKLFVSSAFAGIRFPEGETNEEFSVMIPILIESGGIICTDKVLYFYRVTEGSTTGSYYMHEVNSGLVLKNLSIIKEQLSKYCLPCNRAYRFFSASCAFNVSLEMEKHYSLLTPIVRKNYRKYRKLMWYNCVTYIFSKYASTKNKLLYGLVLTRLLRPLYSMFYKKHL